MTTRKPKPPNPATATSASNVVPLRETAPSIEPEEGWQLHTEHGFMRWDSSAAGRLVSLAAVADSLSANLPRAEVVYRLWSPLIAMASDGNEPAVYVTNSQSYAKALIANGRPTQHTSDVWEFLPSVDGRSSAEDVFRDLADGWDRCWKGLSDPCKDVQHSRQQARARSMELNRKIYWPEDGFLLTLLSRVAVPLAVAADLWGWGKAVPSVDAVAKADDGPQDATNDAWWSTWCAKRNTANTLSDGSAKQGNAREGYTNEDLQVLGLRLKTLMGRGLSESAAKTSMASDLEMTTQALVKQLKKLITSEAQANNQAVQKVN